MLTVYLENATLIWGAAPVYQYARMMLEQIGAALREDHPGQIVSIHAFGSRARGDHNGDSDFDVLVVVRERTIDLEEQIISRFVEQERTNGISFDPVIKSVESFEQERRYRTRFYENIMSEGIPV
ncbi:MAG: nucleotidyltransferase domain-containing protein [Alkalispirochaeta sp.]